MRGLHAWVGPLAVVLLAALLLVGCGGGGHPPTAQVAQPDAIRVGMEVLLDGTASADADGDALAFEWTLEAVPEGSLARLEDAAEAVASIVPDVPGTYRIRLVVSAAGAAASTTLTLSVDANLSPIADAGDNLVVKPGDTVELDARASADADGDLLSYAWRFLAAPAGSTAAFDRADARTPRFVADKPGVYHIELTVHDGASSATDSVSVRANRPPHADAGADLAGRIGTELWLDGSDSSDPDGDALTYAWTLLSAPSGSAAIVRDASTLSAGFTPDATGDHVLELVVSDGSTEAKDRVIVHVLPADGAAGSVLHVAPDGDDANAGSSSQPLRTLGAALAAAASNATVSRVRLAPGTYEDEPFDYEVARDLQIVGPDDPATPATLQATGDLLRATGDAHVALVRLRLVTGATAVDVGDDADVSLIKIRCMATTCLRSGVFLGEGGGSVSITDSALTSGPAASSAGVRSVAGDGLSINRTTITGFDTGVALLATPTTIIDSTLSDNGVGLQILLSDSAAGVLLSGSMLAGNATGVSALAAKNVAVRDTVITESTAAGVRVDSGGAMLLDGVSITNGDLAGLIVEDGASDGAVVTVRDSSLVQNQGNAIAVYGAESFLDLGDGSAPGNNVLHSYFQWSLYDGRPAGASGVIQMSRTTLDGRQPDAGTYAGPQTDITLGLKIVNGNEVTVY